MSESRHPGFPGDATAGRLCLSPMPNPGWIRCVARYVILGVMAWSQILAVGPAGARMTEPADPFAEENVDSTEVPAPEGPEWEAPPPPPPPVPPPVAPSNPRAESHGFGATAVPSTEAPAKKGLLYGAIAVTSLGGASAGLAYYSFDKRRATEAQLADLQRTNTALVAAGLPPRDTTTLEKESRRYKNLSVGLAVSAAVLLVTGGLLFIANSRRKARGKPLTWAPALHGIEVSF